MEKPKTKRMPKPRRVECKFIANEGAREVTFSKRHRGLFRKAAELSILCGAEVAVIAYSPHGNPFAFAHPSTPDTLIDRYLSGETNGHTAVEAAAYRKQYEESVRKLQEVKGETERIKAKAGGAIGGGTRSSGTTWKRKSGSIMWRRWRGWRNWSS